MVTVRLVTNPDTDGGFKRRAEELARQVDTPEALESLLRTEYRNVRVVLGVTDVVERWYVYRDGHWINTLEV